MTDAQFRAVRENATSVIWRKTILPTEADFIRQKDKTAVAVRDRIMAALGMNHSLFERSERCDGCGFLLRYEDRPQKRATLWRAMREAPERPSFPSIARVCGMTTHTPVMDAVAGKSRAKKRPRGIHAANEKVFHNERG